MQVAKRKKITTKKNGQPKPVISVIIPAYNTEKYIAKCLDSVIAQFFTDWEAICIDDGSTDKSLAIFKKYAAKDKRIKVMHQNNLGVCAARNNAIAAARGEYIFPLDSDDWIATNCLAVLHKIITTTKYVAVCPLGQMVYENGDKPRPLAMPEPTRENMYSWRNVLHNSTMYPKKFWEKYGGYDEAFRDLGAEDFDFYLNFVDDNQPFTQAEGELFYYRIKSVEESRNSSILRDKETYTQTKETMFAKRPIMRMLSPNGNSSIIKLFGIIPILKIERKSNKTILRLFNFIPLWQIRYKQNRTIYRLFSFLPLFISKSEAVLKNKNALSVYYFSRP